MAKASREITDTEAWCGKHLRMEPLSAFRQRGSGPDIWCIEARREYNRQWSRNRYAPKKAEVAARRAEPPKTRTCRGECGRELPVERFPERYDRPGKREARCSDCMKAQHRQEYLQSYWDHRDKRRVAKKQYQQAHPGYNRASQQRRRARRSRVRQERYTPDEIYERDGGLCHFCRETVDRSLPPDHPMSRVIHHHQPYSKAGPDIGKNVATAHRQCNGEWGDRYDSPLADWRVERIDWHVARDAVVAHHYLHRMPSVSWAYGLLCENELLGVVTFGSPASYRTVRSVADDPELVLELNRLWVDDEAPHGAASWFVARALKLLPPKIVIAYADLGAEDPRYGTNHQGTVYRALSFRYAGQSRAKTDWRLPGNTRNVGKRTEGSVPVKVAPRNRYWTTTGNRAERRLLADLCRWPVGEW